MTQENKDLLVSDLCCRLPYGVKISVEDRVETLEGIDMNDYVVGYSSWLSSGVEDVKPYLFPLSSMTDAQKEEYESLCIKETSEYSDLYGIIFAKDHYYDTIESIDYLYKNHIDVRGLIPMGLAIDATGKNIY
jgi:hypothetical protein